GPMGLCAIGIGPALVRSVARARGINNRSGLHSALQTVVFLNSFIGISGAFLIAVLGPGVFMHFFTKTDVAWGELRFCFLCIGLQWFVTQVIGALSSLSIGLQRYEFTASAQGLTNILTTGLGVFAVYLGYGLPGYVAA